MLGRRLTPTEIASYRHVPEALSSRVRVVAISRLPGRYVGLTLGPLVVLAEEVSDAGDSPLLAHELVHVRQWSEQGSARFAARYVGEFVTALARTRSWHESYRGLSAEVEAREETTRWAQSRS